MRATSIQLYSRRFRDDDGNPAYCGCYTVPCLDNDPRVADLNRLNLGRGLEEDGSTTRAFFFADEIDEMVAKAERETECNAETPWEYPRAVRVDVDPHDEPFFSPEAQETFSAGDRVFLLHSHPLGTVPRHLLPEGTYLGYDFSEGGAEVAVVEWDEGHQVRHASFADIRNLYR